MVKILSFLLLIAAIDILCIDVSFARQAASPADTAGVACNNPEANQFDFWIGVWDLEWDNGGKGRNVIEKTLDGCVILETFDGTPAIPLQGMSVSSYNPQTGKWQQTWVDNQGAYLDFEGEYLQPNMVLQRATQINGDEVLQRMVWYDISDDSLLWNWERSDDEGESWTVLWKIRYTKNGK